MPPLPILNVHLNPCHEDWQQMTPTQQGRHCQRCNRTVVDFTTATQADLDAARAASVDGRLCGRFREAQLRPAPQLRPKLRRFLVALVLVRGLGLSAREVAAQVSRTARCKPTTELQLKTHEELSPLALAYAETQPLAPVGALPQPPPYVGMVVEPMPEFKGGLAGLRAYIKQNLKYPAGTTASGKVFVSFLVTKTGSITDASITKGADPLLDAAALRVVRQMPAWKPARQNGKSSEMRYTIPISFSREP